MTTPPTNDDLSAADVGSRLGNIEHLLQELHIQLHRESIRRRNRQCFRLLVASHCVLTLVALFAEEELAYDGLIIWGWLTGANASLSIGLGFSLEPVAQNCLRCVIAVIAVLASMIVFYDDISISYLFDYLPLWSAFFAIGCGGVSYLIRRFLRLGMGNPDLEYRSVKGIDLTALFVLIASTAALLASSKFLGDWLSPSSGDPEPETLLPIACYGLAIGCLLTTILIYWLRHATLGRRILIGLELLIMLIAINLCAWNMAALVTSDSSIGIWDWHAFTVAVPYLTIFSCLLLLSPVFTACVLSYSGQQLLDDRQGPAAPKGKLLGQSIAES